MYLQGAGSGGAGRVLVKDILGERDGYEENCEAVKGSGGFAESEQSL